MLKIKHSFILFSIIFPVFFLEGMESSLGKREFEGHDIENKRRKIEQKSYIDIKDIELEVKNLLNDREINAYNEKGYSVLHEVIKNSKNVFDENNYGYESLIDEYKVMLLLDQGADPNQITKARFEYGLTPIFFAIQKNLRIARLLVKAGTDIHKIREKKEMAVSICTPLLYVLSPKKGQWSDCEDKNNQQKAERVVYSQVEFLLMNGADVNQWIEGCKLPLAILIVGNNPKRDVDSVIIEYLLIKHNANVNLVFNNKTLIDYAFEKNRKSLVSLLIAAGANYHHLCKKDEFFYENFEKDISKFICKLKSQKKMKSLFEYLIDRQITGNSRRWLKPSSIQI